MATLNELVYDLTNLIRSGRISDDEPLSPRLIEFWIQNTRSRLIRNDLEKKRSINPDLIQTLGCVPLSPVDASECGCTTVGCKVLRTDSQIPHAIELYQKNLITRVGPINTLEKPYTMISYHRVPFIGSDKFTKKLIRSVLHNGYIYLILNDKISRLSMVNIQGVFEDPTEAGQFNHCNGDACYTSDSTYPISSVMIEDMKKMIIDNNFKIAISAPTDNLGNASHEVESNVEQ